MDGFRKIDYCIICSKEAEQLIEECKSLAAICSNCGQKYYEPDCPQCQKIRQKFLTNSRNFPKSEILNNLFNSKTKGTKL
jgi:putative ribosome biogenesis GTPase RsgA